MTKDQEWESTLILHPGAQEALEKTAMETFGLVEKIELQEREKEFFGWWEPDSTIQITDENIEEEPEAWLPDDSGESCFVFSWIDRTPYGLRPHNYGKLRSLIDTALKTKWAKNSLSTDYIRKCFVDWYRLKTKSQSDLSFCSHFLTMARRDIVRRDVVIPVQNLAVEEGFGFGTVKVVPLKPSFFDQLQESLAPPNHDQRDDVISLITQMRKDMRQCGAIELSVLAEVGYANEAALNLASDAVGLLRFFCGATTNSTRMSPVATLGSLTIPTHHVIVTTTNGAFSYTTGVSVENVDYWGISRAAVETLKQRHYLDAVAGLLNVDELTEFKRAVRAGILAFSRATTFPEMADRLVFAFSAIEGLMLRDQSEAIQQNVGERIAFLITTEPAQRQAIVDNIRKAYRMRSQYIHHRLTALDVEVLDQAFQDIRSALATAAASMNNFKTRDEFLGAIEKRKYGA
ncbi:hypothetical protein GR158_12780 [Shinella sp. AETb1-6]|uniref:HEPN domain-containing protein n=1 Tax=Shinella sp. AETb1-6 TaxID=2692210 RepID=UPI001371DD63|nr:HEPN domain-containing protein [Shinella sp. AETb1-6]MXN51999.1 hypothetical protein [Shinella sp. AETb1-6]